MHYDIQIDDIDKAIIATLQSGCDITNVELARKVNLSPPTIHARIRRLRRLGIIQRCVALMDRKKLGYDMLCFIQVSLQIHQPQQVRNFRERIAALPQVQECYQLTGNIDYLLKVVVQNQYDLQRFLMDDLTPIPGIARFETNLVLTEIKNTTELPVPD